MLHVETTPTLPTAAPSVDHDTLCARRWIAAARECGLVVFPWLGSKPGDKGVMEFGQEMDGPNDYGAATARFLKHPARCATDGCRRGVVFETLCAEMGIDEDDPDLCKKVNAWLAANPSETQQAAE